MKKHSNRFGRIDAITRVIGAAALLGSGLVACGPASEAAEARGALDVGAAEATSENGSFLDRVLSREPATVEVTVPAGTFLKLRLDDSLSSRTSQVGDNFHATLEQEISVDGRLAFPRGSRVEGRVTEASQATKVGGRARLAVDFVSIASPEGDALPIDASLRQVGKSEKLKDGAIIAGSTAAGIVLGEAIDKGEGGILGAIAGGVGGYFAARETKGKALEIPAGTALGVETERPVVVKITL